MRMQKVRKRSKQGGKRNPLVAVMGKGKVTSPQIGLTAKGKHSNPFSGVVK